MEWLIQKKYLLNLILLIILVSLSSSDPLRSSETIIKSCPTKEFFDMMEDPHRLHKLQQYYHSIECNHSGSNKLTTDKESPVNRLSEWDTLRLQITNIDLDHIIECSQYCCMYNRSKFRTRAHFEEKIKEVINNINSKNNRKVNIMFYNSYLLYQELKIILLHHDKIGDIHLFDMAYKQFELDDNNKYHLCFEQFLSTLNLNGIFNKVIIHTNQSTFTKTQLMEKKIDLIGAIDIDSVYGIIERKDIKDISKHLLNDNGSVVISQNFTDQLDICHYKIDTCRTVNIEKTNDYVKPEFYKIQLLKYLLDWFIHPLFFFNFIFYVYNLRKKPMMLVTATIYSAGCSWYFINNPISGVAFYRTHLYPISYLYKE